MPDSALPPVPDGALRAETFYCFEKYGFCRDLPPDRKVRSGIYYRSMAYVDFKVNWILVRMGRPFIYSGSRSYVRKVREYIKENKELLAREVAESDMRNS